MKLPEEIIFSNGVPYGKVGNASQVREIMNTGRMVFESEIVKRYANYDKMKEALETQLQIIEALIGSKRIVNLDESIAYYKQLLESLK